MVRIRTVRGKLANQSQIETMPGAYVWRRDPTLHAGGMLYDDGWHKYATAISWIGEVGERPEHSFDAPTTISMRLPAQRYGSSRTEIASACWNTPQRLRWRYVAGTIAADEFFEIQGSKGAIWVTRCTGEMLDLPPVMVVKGTETTGIQVPMDWIEGFSGAARQFIDCILSRTKQPDMDIDFSRHTMQMAMAVYKAADEGTPRATPRS